MEYLTNQRGERVAFDEFITWPSHKQHCWSRRGVARSPEIVAKVNAYWDAHPTKKKTRVQKALETKAMRPWVEKQRKIKIKQKAKEQWAQRTPEQLEAMKDKIRKTLQATQARKKRLGIKQKCGWDGKTPKQREAIKQKIREKARVNSKLQWQDPAYREKHRKAMENFRDGKSQKNG